MTEGIEIRHSRAHHTAERRDLEANAHGDLASLNATMEGADYEPAHDRPCFTPAPFPTGEHASMRDRSPSGEARRHILAEKSETNALAFD